VFTLVLWQPNPSTSNGLLVPTTWDASTQTGYAPGTQLTAAQLGFQDKPGTSTAQMYSDAVGVYLNSQDLLPSTVSQKMMITPQFQFAPGNVPVPFASTGSSLGAAMDLQIPTAVGNDVYVVMDFLFQDAAGVRISYGAEIFHNGTKNGGLFTGYDAPSNSYMFNSPVGVVQPYLTSAPGSAAFTGTPWMGWQHFEWSISQAQFVAALNYLVARYPGQVTSTDPTQYALVQMHLNAEFHFLASPAELGWSMRGWTVWTSP
jgi:hypothetical protein